VPAQAGGGDVAAVPDSSAVSLDWEGAYRGITPCADCEGIETAVTLAREASYRVERRHLVKSDEFVVQQGGFSWDAAGGTVAFHGLEGGPNRYLVGEGYLLQLDIVSIPEYRMETIY
jgi:uncharacterized lipoprotein NlpE involved in copper resistance